MAGRGLCKFYQNLLIKSRIFLYLIPNLFYIDTGAFFFCESYFLSIKELAYDKKSACRC
jgi:hypothetical protein